MNLNFNQGGHHDGTFQEHEKQVEVSDDEMNKKKKGRRVLEIGSGPVPISMISASRWSEWIVCSDFLEQNRQNIKQWLLTMTATTTSTAAAPGRHDDDETWLPFFRYVTELERAEYFYFFLIEFPFPFVCDASVLFHIRNFYQD
jgi:nicotinamide N-methyltransferase/methyltransferase